MDRKRCGSGIGAGLAAALAVLALAAVPAVTLAQKAGGAAVLPKAKGLPPPTVPGSAPKVPGQPAAATTVPMGPGGPVTGGRGASSSVQAPAQDLEDVMSFKTNFEKDVKCVPLPLNAKISVDFEEAPLYDVVKFIACITQRNYLIAANLKQGKNVTILSTTPVTVYEAYKAFLSALDINGLTAIPAGKFYKIIDTAKAKTEPVPFYGAHESVPDEDRLITRIVALRYIDVKDLEPILAKFKTAAGDISSYAPGNSLIVTDLGRNVIRMLRFVSELDIPTGREKIWVRPVQYANATDMANLVTSLFGDKAAKGGGAGGRAGGTAGAKAAAAGANAAAAAVSGGDTMEGPSTLSKVIADERTNQLIIVATPAAYLKIDHLLRRMDMPIEGEGQIHIYYLENSTAEDVASTLSSLTSGGGAKKAPAGKGAAGGGGGAAASLFAGEVKITAHKPTNSLVIESSLKDYLAVKRVVQQLDVRRKQVYVEAVIMEISSNKDRKLGISASGGASLNIAGEKVPLLVGKGGLGMSGLDLSQLNKGGLAMGLTGPLLDVSTGSTGSTSTAGSLALPTYGFLLQAIQTNSDVNILSTPHILTMDNEEAEIVVGKTIPYQASTVGSGLSSLLGNSALSSLTGGATSATSSLASSLLGGSSSSMGQGYVQRIDVDLTLKITPQISESNFVRLKINQQIDDVESLDATLGPTTSKRKVANTVVVRDQQAVVIGGLMRDIEVTGVDKVPFLGDIPILGILFRKTNTRIEKRNLLMVITPYIIEDPSDLRRIHEQKMDELRTFAELMSTKQKEAAGNVDYRKKTGVMEDIRKTMERVRKDRDVLEQTRFEEVDRVGAPETHDLEYDPFAPSGPAPSPAGPEGGAAPPKPEPGSVAPGAVTPAAPVVPATGDAEPGVIPSGE
jgi:general secretion pathway protein D